MEHSTVKTQKNNSSIRPIDLPTPTKNIFEDFLLTAASHKMPVFKKSATDPKNNRDYNFSCEFIAVFRTMFMNMYHNRLKSQYGYQEICHLSFSEIAKQSRNSKDTVKRAIQYGIMVGFFEQITTEKRTKCKYKVGHFKFESYTQKVDK